MPISKIQGEKEMSISKWSTEKISNYQKLSEENYQKVKYGFDILYINFSKTAVLLLLTIMLRITKETFLLLCSFTCVRFSGFGYHSNNNLKCTVVGIAGFVFFTYIAISLNPFNILVVSVIYLFCIVIFFAYAPVETKKRPIGTARKRYFKKVTFVTSTVLFFIAVYIGENVYRNLIIMGILLEAIMILPIMKKIIL